MGHLVAAGTELARAYVTILPQMPGLAARIGAGLNGSDVAREADRAGTSLGARLAGGVSTALKATGAAVAAVGLAVAGLAIKGGIARQLQIEDAQKKLESLGHSTGTISKIMEDALKSVKGTAFSMGDAATLAASAVAAGVKPGAELQRYLSLVGDAAVVAGVGMDEMGSIFGKVQTQGAAYTEELNQLAERGIPIYQWLAEEYGVTAVELRKMVASGQVDAATYQKVIEENIGGAALKMGETTRGAFSNMMAALSRVGVQLTQWFFPLIKTVFNSITGVLDTATDILKPYSEAFAAAFQAKAGPAIIAFGASVADVMGKVGAAFTLFKTGDFTAEIGKALNVEEDSPLVSVLMTIRDLITGPMAAAFSVVGAAIKSLWDILGPTFAALGPQILELVSTISPLHIIFQALQPVLPQIGAAIMAVAQAMSGVLAAILPVIVSLIGTLVQALSGALATVLPVIAGLLTMVAKVIADTLVALLPVVIPLIQLVAQAFTQLMPIISTLVTFIGTTLSSVLQALMPTIIVLAQTVSQILTIALATLLPVIQMVVTVAIALINALLPLVPALLNVVNSLLPLIPVLLQLVTALFPVLNQLILALLPILTGLVTLLVTLLVPIINAFATAIQWLVGKITTAVTWFVNLANQGASLLASMRNVWTGIKNAASAAWDWIGNHVFAPFKRGIDALGTAFQSVKSIIGMAWNGIQNAALAPVNFIIQTVYTNGIKALFDKVAGALGLSLRLPNVNPIGGGARGALSGAFASGGVLPGYTPGRDVHRFYSPTGGQLDLSGGEAIMRPEFTRAMGGARGIAQLNAYYSGKSGAAGGGGAAFKDGGIWGWVKDKVGGAWDFATNAAGAAISFMKDPVAGALKIITKPVEALLNGIGAGDVGQILAGAPKAILKGIVEKATSIFGEPRDDSEGVATGGGSAGMGYKAMIATLKNVLPGVGITSTYRPGARTTFGNLSMHGMGRAVDMAPSMNAFNTLNRLFPNSAELLYSPAGGRQIQRGRGGSFRGDTSGATKAMHYNHVHWAMKNGGVFDNGGMLPPGGVAVNLSKRPEPVFSGDQWDTMKDSNRVPSTIIVRVGDREFVGFVEDVADERIGAADRTRSGYRGFHV